MSSPRSEAEGLLRIEGLTVRFGGLSATGFHGASAVDGLELHVEPGETLGLVGESGSGKSVTSLAILGLLPEAVATVESGQISWLGRDLVRLSERQLRRVRGREISMVFQEAGRSLNPVIPVGRQVAEVVGVHEGLGGAAARRRAVELLHEVGIPDPDRRLGAYAHELSGGQKQRAMIAMALAGRPRLLIADEPTSALDVTVQARILALLRRLRDERGMAMLFISHDLGVIAEIADRVAVVQRGRVVEEGDVVEIFERPSHAYTRALLACRPRVGVGRRRFPTIVETAEGVQIRTPDAAAQPRLLPPPSRLAELGWPEGGDWQQHEPRREHVEEGVAPIALVRGLSVRYPIFQGPLRRKVGEVTAVHRVDLEIYRGQTLGLVGESGSGKTTVGLALLRLLSSSAEADGEIELDGERLDRLGERELRPLRRRMQVVLQDPYGSLDPRMTVGALLIEAMTVHGLGGDRGERRERAAALLAEVGLDTALLGRLPHALSGGQRQRVAIARALAVEPELLVLDEAVSALDVSVQAQVLNLLQDLQRARGLSYLFVSHDLSVVESVSDMIAVMQKGRLVEVGPAGALCAAPRHRPTRQLLEAVPDASLEELKTRRARRLRRRQLRG